MRQSTNPFLQLNQWYQQPLGQAVSALLLEELQAKLPKLFGYHLAQLGLPEQAKWLDSSPILHKIFSAANVLDEKASLYADFDHLPFATNSVDVMVMPHTLEYAADPQTVLQEVTRVLMPEGYAVIIGFNPMSWWGLRHVLFQYRKKAPWRGKFIPVFKLSRHLIDLNYEIIDYSSVFYRPPVASPFWMKKLLFLETFGKLCWPYPGGIYLLVAQKRITELTPIQPIWRFRNFVVGKSFVQPTT